MSGGSAVSTDSAASSMRPIFCHTVVKVADSADSAGFDSFSRALASGEGADPTFCNGRRRCMTRVLQASQRFCNFEEKPCATIFGKQLWGRFFLRSLFQLSPPPPWPSAANALLPPVGAQLSVAGKPRGAGRCPTRQRTRRAPVHPCLGNFEAVCQERKTEPLAQRCQRRGA